MVRQRIAASLVACSLFSVSGLVTSKSCSAQDNSPQRTTGRSTSPSEQHGLGEKEPPGISGPQADLILAELRQIRQLLEQQQVQLQRAFLPSVPVSNKVRLEVGAEWHAIGRADAPVTIVEFTDLQCTFCRRFHIDTFPTLKKEYVDTGKVRFVTRDLPLDFHQYAQKAAVAARCAGDQGKFWEMRGTILESDVPATDDFIFKQVGNFKLDRVKFQTCLDSGQYQTNVRKDRDEATSLEITGTPTFIVARTAKTTLEGTRMTGAHSFSEFQARIDELLSENSGDNSQ